MLDLAELERIIKLVLIARRKDETYELTERTFVIKTVLPSVPGVDDVYIGVGIGFGDVFTNTLVLGSSIRIFVVEGTLEQYWEKLESLREYSLGISSPVYPMDISCEEDGKSWHYDFSSAHLFPYGDPVLGNTEILTTLLLQTIELHMQGVAAHFSELLSYVDNSDASDDTDGERVLAH